MKKITLLLALIVINMACFGQVSTYTFASSAGTYTPLSGGTALVPPGSGISGAGWFCQNFNVTLPFVFYYNGIGYSDVYVNSNGYLTFGAPAYANRTAPHQVNDGQAGTITALASSTGYGYSASASGRIWLGSAIDKTNSNPILYSTTGSAPNRIFVVQWTDCERSVAYFGGSGAVTENITFQIRLYETSNIAEIVYNTSATNTNSAGVTNFYPTIGLCGASTTDFNLLDGLAFSSVTNTTTTVTASVLFNSTSGIDAGTTFTFTPPSGLQPTACSGTPTTPTAIATHGITCGSVPVGIGLTNLPLSTGLTYQWQSSATGVPGSWSNISGATNPSYVATLTATTHFQCLVACGSGTPVASSSVVVGYQSSCPGMPSYSYNQFASYPTAQIGRFSIAGAACGSGLNDVTNSASAFNYTVFNGTSGTQYSYLDMTSQPYHIKLLGSSSTTTSYTVTMGNYGSTATYGVWLDINDDGVFTGTGEYIGSVQSGGATFTFNITIPANAFGVHRMRVRGTSTAYNTSTITPTGFLSGTYGQTNDYKVEIVPPTPTPTNSSPVCVTGALNLTSPSYTGGVYTWSGPASYYATTTSTTQSYTVPSTSAGGTYTLYTTVNGANACTGATTTVTVNAQPALSSASNNSPVCSGGTLNLTANSPTDVTGYAWVGPVAITSSGSATASVPGITPIGGGTYSVTVNNGSGSGCTRTYITTATVNPLPTAISGPTQLCIGNTVTLGSSGTGTWSSSNSGVASVGSTTGVVSGVSAGTANITYTLTSTGCYVTSTVTVNAPPAGISGGTSPFCPGATTTLTNGTSGGAWSSSDAALATVGSSTGIVTGVSGGSPVITYTLGTGCFSTATVTVISTPAITGGVGLCVGATSTLSNAISGGSWVSSNPGVATIGSSSGVVSGVSLGSTVVTYTFPSTCTITATVNVTPSPSVYTVSGGGTTCTGATGVHVLLSGSDAGVSYQMYTGVTPFGTPMFGTGGPLDFGTITTGGTYSVIANPGTSCSATMTSVAVVALNPSPNVFNVYGGGGYCTGATGVHVYLSGSNSGINYQLYNGASAVGTPLSGSGTILDFGLLTAAGTYSVTATNTVTGCTSDMNGTATVTINPLPVAYTVTGTGGYCTGGTGVLVGLSGTDAGIDYQLYRGGVAVGSAVAGTGGSISFGYQTVAGSYTVIGTNTTTGCTANMTGAANITINTLPAIFSVTGGGSYCEGGTGVAVGLSGSSVGVSYQLYEDGVPVSGSSAVAGTGTAISFGNQIWGFYYVVATNTATGCTNEMLGTATVIENPLPTSYTVTGGGNYCLGAEGEYVGLSGSDVGTSYFLYKDGTLVDGASGTSAALSFGLHTAAGFYTVSATIPGTGCSAVFPGGVTITIDPLPIAYAVTGGGSYCAGGAGFSIDLSSSESGVNYVMNSTTTVSAMVAGTGSSISFGTYTDGGVYTVTAINSSTGCFSNMTGSATIIKNPLPTAYTVTGGGSYCADGTGVNVGVGNSNTGISYQLLKDGLSSGAAVTGTGGAISFGPRTDAGTYTVEATNIATGCMNMMSGSVTIAINPLPTANNVTGGGNYCAGGSGVAVGLDNSESGVNYQLYRGTTAIGGSLAGTTGASINFGLQAIAGTYTVKAINALTGCMQNMTGSAAVAVDPLPAAFTVTGGGDYCTGGSGVNVGLSNSVIGVDYQLYNGGSTVGAPMTGSGFALDFGMQTATGTYTVIATDMTAGCTMTMSGSAVVNTNVLPVVYAVTGGGNYCAGGAGVHVGLVSSQTGVNYQLQIGTSAAGGMVAGTGGALDFGAQTMGGVYTVKATNAVTGCTINMSGTATVVMNALPAVQIVTGGGNYCLGGLGLHIGLTGSQTGVSYQLYNGGLMVGLGTAGTGSALDFGFQTGVGTYSVVATNTLSGCTNNMSGTASIAISSMPTVYTVTGDGNYCPAAGGSSVGLNGSDIGVDYQLLKGGLPEGSPVAGTGSALDFGLHSAGVYTIKATGTGTSCVGNMFDSAMVGVHLSPIIHNVTGTGSYCAGDAGLAIGVDATEVGNTYQLYLGGVLNGLPVAGTGSAIDFGMKTLPGVYTVVATSDATTCTSPMAGSGIITVNTLPTAYNVSGGGSYCSGGTGVHVFLNNSTPGVDYQLYNGVDPIGPSLPGTGSVLDFGSQTPGGNYTITGTNTLTGCSKAMSGSATINVLALPAAFEVEGGGNFCAGGTGVNVTLTGSQVGVSYQLYRAGIFAVGSPKPGTGSSINFGLQTTSGSYTVSAINTSTMCVNNMTGSATVVEMALPTVYTVSGSSAGYCIGGTGVTPILAYSEYGVSYQLFRGSTPIGTPLPGSGGPVSFLPQTTAGSYTVIGTNNASGCTNSMAGGASVTIYSLPTIYTVTGGGSYCSGGTGVNVGLSGSDIGTNYQLIIGGAPGPIVAGTGSTLNFGLQTTGGYYTVKATNANGCVQNMTGSASVTISALPTALGVTGGGNYCSGSAGVPVGLSGSVMGISYRLYWGTTPIGSAILGTGSPINFGMQTLAGGYTVMATNTATGCTRLMTGSATVGVNTSPAAYAVAGGGGYCAGGTGVNIGIGGSASGVMYRLYRGTTLVTGPIAGTGAAIDFGMQTVAGTYSVTGTDAISGCVTNMGSTSVVVNANPAVYSVTGGGNYCAGGTGVHIGLSNSATGVDYELSTGSSAVVTLGGTGSALDFGLQTTSGSYTVTATNASTGCSTAMTGSATVITNPVVVPSVSISTGVGDTVCSGMLTTFTAAPVNGGSSPTYQWTINGVPVGTAGGSYSYLPLNGDLVGVQMTSSASCATPVIATSNMAVTVNAPRIPAVSSSANPGNTVCQGSTVTLSAVPVFGGSAPAYMWMKNGVGTGVTTNTYTYAPNNGDNVYCIMYSNYRCRLQDSALSTAIVFSTTAPAVPVVTITADPSLTIGPGAALTLTASATNAGPAPTYLWKVNGIAIPAAIGETYVNNTYRDQDQVTCEVRSSGACAGALGSKTVTVRVHGVGVQEIGAANIDVKLLPNPNKGTFALKGNLGTAADGEVTIEITNMLGQSIFTGNAKSSQGMIDEHIQLSNTLANGMYILNLRTEGGTKVFHLVIEQ